MECGGFMAFYNCGRVLYYSPFILLRCLQASNNLIFFQSQASHSLHKLVNLPTRSLVAPEIAVISNSMLYLSNAGLFCIRCWIYIKVKK